MDHDIGAASGTRLVSSVRRVWLADEENLPRIALGIFATQMRFLVVKRDPFENQKLGGPVQASNQIVASVSRSNNDLPEPLWSTAEFAVGVELGQHIRR